MICILDEYLRHFNSRAHVERDDVIPYFINLAHISTHALTWSATPPTRMVRYCCDISTHALTWSATSVRDTSGTLEVISTHALTWSATYIMTDNTIRAGLFQLTRSRGARPYRDLLKAAGVAEISTHALTWSATFSIRCQAPFIEISTHALTWSATIFNPLSSPIHRDFNSRAHVERDCDLYAQI